MKDTATIIIILIIGGVIGFLIGHRFTFRTNFINRIYPMPQQRIWGRGMMSKMRFMGGNVSGQINKIDNNTITLQTANGFNYTITIGDNAVINKGVKGSKNDLKVGENITILGDNRYGNQIIWISP